MCYGISFPAMTVLNQVCHTMWAVSMRIFPKTPWSTTGDDNSSAHKARDSIDRLVEAQEAVGFVVNRPKSFISQLGYIHAENLYLKLGNGITEKQPVFRFRTIFPVDNANKWVTMPRAAYDQKEGLHPEQFHRLMQYIYNRYCYDYNNLYTMGIDIFGLPLGRPIFPHRLRPYLENGQYSLSPDKRVAINRLFEPSNDQHLDLTTFTETIKLWDMPDYRYVNLREVDFDEIRHLPRAETGDAKKIASRYSYLLTPNPYRNALPGKSKPLLSQHVAVAYNMLRGTGHLSPSEYVKPQTLMTSGFNIALSSKVFDSSRMLTTSALCPPYAIVDGYNLMHYLALKTEELSLRESIIACAQWFSKNYSSRTCIFVLDHFKSKIEYFYQHGDQLFIIIGDRIADNCIRQMVSWIRKRDGDVSIRLFTNDIALAASVSRNNVDVVKIGKYDTRPSGPQKRESQRGRGSRGKNQARGTSRPQRGRGGRPNRSRGRGRSTLN